MSRWIVAGALVAALFVSGCGHAQMGPSREAFEAVDALYTAVSLRDPNALTRCVAAIDKAHTSGELPAAAYAALNGVVGQARDGKWKDARSNLAEFMRGQKR